MKVKELIKRLNKFPSNMEMACVDITRIEGNEISISKNILDVGVGTSDDESACIIVFQREDNDNLKVI